MMNSNSLSFLYDVKRQVWRSCSYAKCQGWRGDDSGFYEQRLAPVFAKVRAAKSELLHGSTKVSDNLYLLDNRFADYSVKQISQLIKKARAENDYFMIPLGNCEFVILSLSESAKTVTIDLDSFDQVTVDMIKEM